MDFLPTLCGISGIEIDHEIDGHNLAQVWLKGAEGTPERTMIWVRCEGNTKYQGRAYYAIRQGDWNLLQNNPFEPMMLVNLKNDPYEKNPLPAKGKIAKQLSETLIKHINRSGSIPWRKATTEEL